MNRFLISVFLMILTFAQPVLAQSNVGLYVRNGTGSITSPTANQTWIFDAADNNAKIWNGTSWETRTTPHFNFTGNGAPTVSTDSTLGYLPGSVYFDQTARQIYVCLDNSVGAAVWSDYSISNIATSLATYTTSANERTLNYYSVNSGDSTVSVVSGATNTVTTTVNCPSFARCITTNPDASKFYVGDLFGTVSVGATNGSGSSITSTISCAGSSQYITASPNGRYVYVSNANGSNISNINGLTDTLTGTIGVGGSPAGIAFSPDNSKAYVCNFNDDTLSVIDTGSSTVTTTISSVGHHPNWIAVNPKGTTAYIADEGSVGDTKLTIINLTNNTVSGTITLSDFPNSVSWNPNGTQAYVTMQTLIAVIDATNNTVTTTFSPGAAGPNEIAYSPDGSIAYCSTSAGKISVINTNTNTVTTTVNVGTTPLGVATRSVPASLPNSLQWLNGTGTSLDYSTSGGIKLNNTGVLSLIAGTGIGVSGATGNVTVSNTGVRSVAATTTGFTFLTISGSPITTTGTLTLSPLGTTGDLPYCSTTNNYASLPIGSSGNVLTVSGGLPTWAAPAPAGVTSVAQSLTGLPFISISGSPITTSGTLALTAAGTTGDLPYFSASNVMSKLGIGSTGNVLTVAGGVPTWAASSGGLPQGFSGDPFKNTLIYQTGTQNGAVAVIGNNPNPSVAFTTLTGSTVLSTTRAEMISGGPNSGGFISSGVTSGSKFGMTRSSSGPTSGLEYLPTLTGVLTTQSPITSMQIFFGFSSTSTGEFNDNPGTSSHNFIGFRYSTSAGDTTWQCITANAVASTITNSAVTVSANTNYKFFIDCTNTASIKFYINGVLVATNTTNIPSVSFGNIGEMLSMQNLAASGRQLGFGRIYEEEY